MITIVPYAALVLKRLVCIYFLSAFSVLTVGTILVYTGTLIYPTWIWSYKQELILGEVSSGKHLDFIGSSSMLSLVPSSVGKKASRMKLAWIASRPNPALQAP